MAITISGANNVDKILATDGVLDSISGFNVVGVMTAGTFDVTGKTTTGHLNVGSNIHIGNAGIITATTLIGNVTGNINHTSNLLLQISGSEKFRVGTSGQLGIGGANYGTSGQVLKSGGSGSAPTWGTISTDLVSDTSPQLGGLLESNGSNIKMADSDIIVLGTGNDLQISHTSNISRLRGATTNDIHIESAANFKVRHQDTDGSNAEDMLICTGDGAVELYFNNSKKIESTNTGAVITGICTATSFSGSGANLTGVLSDIVEDTSPQLGADLDVNNHNIKNGTAILDISTNARFEFNVAGSEIVDINGNGVDFTSGNLVVVDNVKLKIGSGTDLEIFHDGTDSHIDNNNGDLYLTTTGSGDDVHIRAVDDVQIKVQGTENAVICSGNGSVDLYYDGTKKFETTDTGVKIDGGLLEIAHTSCHVDFMETSTTNHRLRNGSGNFHIQRISDDKNTTTTQFLVDGGTGSVELYHEGTKKLSTQSGGICFNSDTADANALSDYEEGTFTPDWRGASALGTTTYGSYNSASYIKVGNQVTVRGYSELNGTSGGSGMWFIHNLPFTVKNGHGYRSVGSVLIENFNLDSDIIDVVCFANPNNNHMHLRGTRDNANYSSNIRAQTDDNFEVAWTLTYQVS